MSFMISVEEQRELYAKILDMTRTTLKLLDEDQVEEAMCVNAEKLEIITFLAVNRNSCDEIKDDSKRFCLDYFALNDLMTEKIQKMKEMINQSIKNGRIAGRKICKYNAVSQIGHDF